MSYVEEKLTITAGSGYVVNRVYVYDLWGDDTNGTIKISETNRQTVTVELTSRFSRGMRFRIIAYRIKGEGSKHHKGFRTTYRNSFCENDYDNMSFF